MLGGPAVRQQTGGIGIRRHFHALEALFVRNPFKCRALRLYGQTVGSRSLGADDGRNLVGIDSMRFEIFDNRFIGLHRITYHERIHLPVFGDSDRPLGHIVGIPFDGDNAVGRCSNNIERLDTVVKLADGYILDITVHHLGRWIVGSGECTYGDISAFAGIVEEVHFTFFPVIVLAVFISADRDKGGGIHRVGHYTDFINGFWIIGTAHCIRIIERKQLILYLVQLREYDIRSNIITLVEVQSVIAAVRIGFCRCGSIYIRIISGMNNQTVRQPGSGACSYGIVP